MTYAEKLRELRKNKELSLMGMEKTTGISNCSFSAWERGKYCPTKDSLKTIIQSFKLPQDFFIGCDYIKAKKEEKKDIAGPKHVILHHTPKKQVIVKNDYVLKPLEILKNDYELQKAKVLRELNKLQAEFDTYQLFITDLEIMIEKVKNNQIK